MARELGTQLPVSIGTALAVEDTILIEGSLFEGVVVNISTMFRNFMGSYSKLERPHISEVLDEWIDELGILKFAVEQLGMPFHYIYTQHNNLDKMMPHALLKVPKTDNQKAAAYSEQLAIKSALAQSDLEIKICNTRLPGMELRTALVSHKPIDLLSMYEFKELILVESHTGTLKGRDQWGKKIGTSYALMPLNVLTLQVFGDGKMFYKQPKAMIKALEQLATDGMWTAFKPLTRIRQEIVKDGGDYTDTWLAMLDTKIK